MARPADPDLVADRHAGTADGAAAPLDACAPVHVVIVVDHAAATTRSGQLAVSMLSNLLARSVGSVTAVTLACPQVPLLPGVIPGLPAGQELTAVLADQAAQIGCVPLLPAEPGPVRADQPSVTIGVGAVPDVMFRLVWGDWWGGLAIDDHPSGPLPDLTSLLPFGAFAAAAHAAGEIFRLTRIPEHQPPRTFVHDLWHQRAIANLDGWSSRAAPPWRPANLHLDTALGGVGAVGTAVLACLWACPGLSGRVLYTDDDVVDDTSLNRCVLFDQSAIGHLKTHAAQRRLTGSINTIEWTCDDCTLQTSPKLTLPVKTLISAVDSNRARRDLQALNGEHVLAASTHNLRADLLRAGPPGTGACLLCHNPVEPAATDRQLRARWLAASATERAQIAATIGETVDRLDEWAEQPRCGELDARALPVLAATLGNQPRQFSIGYLSLLAGTMLAAEVVKEAGGQDAGLVGHANRAVFQTVDPTWIRNRPGWLATDAACPNCSDPQRLHAWARRHQPRLAA